MAYIIDASVMVRKYRPMKGTKTFAGYVKFLKGKLEDDFASYNKIDLVFDQYFDHSIKSVTRNNKGSEDAGNRYCVRGNTPLPSSWDKFL